MSVYIPRIRRFIYGYDVIDHAQTTSFGAQLSDPDRLLVQFWELGKVLHAGINDERDL